MWEEAGDLAAGLREKTEFPRWTNLCAILLLQDPTAVGSQESSAVREVSLPALIKRRVS